MNISSMIFIALGLAMDAFAVSIAGGAVIERAHIKNAFKVAMFFGSFQAFMPVIGWLTAFRFRIYISHFDHWIAFILLNFIGIKMIYESFRLEDTEKMLDLLCNKTLTILAVATSIDALAVGLSFAFLNIPIITPIIIIGAITFILSFLGYLIGKKFGHFFEKKIEIFGGSILILISIKILIEHLLH